MIHILCPYCRSPISEGTGICPTCGQDTTRDAAIEMNDMEIVQAGTKKCTNCGASVMVGAVTCPECQKRLTK